MLNQPSRDRVVDQEDPNQMMKQPVTDSFATSDSLHDIAARYGTDKVLPRRSLAGIYDSILSARRQERISLLEIGVFEGASLRMWRDYFPHGRIYGLDRDPTGKQYEEERITILVGDQEDADLLRNAVTGAAGFDVVIDDGGHHARQQLATLLCLWPTLNAAAVYIVEDIHTSYLSKYNMAWRAPGTTVEFLKGVVDDVHAMWHDRLVSLENVASIHFYPETCVIQKQ